MLLKFSKPTVGCLSAEFLARVSFLMQFTNILYYNGTIMHSTVRLFLQNMEFVQIST